MFTKGPSAFQESVCNEDIINESSKFKSNRVMTEMATSADGGEEEKNKTKRRFTKLEIISSEAVYIGRLRAAQDVFLTPMRQQHILEEEELNSQFFLWSSLVDLHADMHEGMVKDEEKGTLNLGERFKLFSHFLKMYGQYLTNFDSAMARRAHLLTSNSKFGDFVQKAQKDTRCNGLTLEVSSVSNNHKN